ncbi:hypothetical protein Poras_0252 [Porphyromonas asaccharolytica DSM 20707]|uniref:Uncharacterized protein n=1 Tax=Porphyromonas asaccharolytica (strain ATCC 25260 / DSM 20707 / BCRC 10618 / CCUG 7834 / JCM 6326 / LMG 13178 / VPI 4198 / B440) TaxID=879243 RepID=F4KM18_PORAD|nr:hypothetical protein Poras_0252 [Porphyromonas asaccharolytica DSM 20707]
MIGSSIKANAMVIIQLLFLSAVFITHQNTNSALNVLQGKEKRVGL